MPATERWFRAMGSACHVVVHARTGAGELAERAETMVRELEDRWTRFRPSEVTAVNASPGVAVGVSPETFDLVVRAVAAWQVTGGAFDPTVSVSALGYDRSFELVGDGARTLNPVIPPPGPAGVVADRDAHTVTVPDGVRLDLGGIGKGRAADLVATGLLHAGATAACVNVGGDLRLVGDRDWPVGVEAPDGTVDRTLVVGAGGIATSSPHGKTWYADGRIVHHVVDPATGQPAATDVQGVTVVAGEAWWAEVLATYVLVRGSASLAGLPALGGEALAFTEFGTVSTPGLAAYVPVVSAS